MPKAFLVRKNRQHQPAPRTREESLQQEEENMQVEEIVSRPSPACSPVSSEGSSHIDVDYCSPPSSPCMTSSVNGEYLIFDFIL